MSSLYDSGKAVGIRNMSERVYSKRYARWLDRVALRGGKILGFDKPQRRKPHRHEQYVAAKIVRSNAGVYTY